MADKKKLTRRESRELAFKLVFAKDFDAEADASDYYDRYTDDEDTLTNEYVEAVFKGVCENREYIDNAIETSSSNWKLSRMSNTTKAILRLAVYEMLFTDTPVKVVINEAVDIIKLYDDENAPAFVNGILNNIGHVHGKIAETQAVRRKDVDK